MKESIYRLNKIIEDKLKDNDKVTVYIISNSEVTSFSYFNYLIQQIRINKVMFKRVNSVKDIHGYSKSSSIVALCGLWYKNTIVKEKVFKYLIDDCYSVPIDEIEPSNNLDESMNRVEKISGVGTNPPTSKPMPEYKPNSKDNQENKGIVVTLDFTLDKAQAYLKGFKDALELKEQHASDELILDVLNQNVHELLEYKIK